VTTAAHVPSEVETYLARVRAALVVVHPDAEPKLKLPRIATPPLPTKKRSR
jgi:hypothetical protein